MLRCSDADVAPLAGVDAESAQSEFGTGSVPSTYDRRPYSFQPPRIALFRQGETGALRCPCWRVGYANDTQCDNFSGAYLTGSRATAA